MHSPQRSRRATDAASPRRTAERPGNRNRKYPARNWSGPVLRSEG
jgi:hypothetical protein